MASDFQDDAREIEMRELFNLRKDDKEGRSGIDAVLDINDLTIDFELKTTANGSVTTVRDFGPDHIKKWENKHWLIGFYDDDGVMYYKYGSPKMMRAWIQEKAQYIQPDFAIVDLISNNLSLEDMYAVIGKKEKYTIDDARALHKRQYTVKKYKELQDDKPYYTPERMLDIFKDRTRYLISRGSTLNNPHIPESYFSGWIEITDDHAMELQRMVKEALEEE